MASGHGGARDGAGRPGKLSYLECIGVVHSCINKRHEGLVVAAHRHSERQLLPYEETRNAAAILNQPLRRNGDEADASLWDAYDIETFRWGFGDVIRVVAKETLTKMHVDSVLRSLELTRSALAKPDKKYFPRGLRLSIADRKRMRELMVALYLRKRALLKSKANPRRGPIVLRPAVGWDRIFADVAEEFSAIKGAPISPETIRRTYRKYKKEALELSARAASDPRT